MSDAEIARWLAKHAGTHEQEIGLRVGPARKVLTELVTLRARLAEVRKQMEASEAPFYLGMKALTAE